VSGTRGISPLRGSSVLTGIRGAGALPGLRNRSSGGPHSAATLSLARGQVLGTVR
jgi:hypothetical protein